MLIPLGDAPIAKKEQQLPKTPLLKKNGSFLSGNNSTHQSQRNLHQVKMEPAKTNTINNHIQERKTVVKGAKPALTVTQPTMGKGDRKIEPKRGIGLAQSTKDVAKQVLRVEQLQDELIRGLSA